MKPINFSETTVNLKQSGIRSAAMRCLELGGTNLAQGLCDIPAHEIIKAAATEAIYTNKNIYAPHEGVFELREALAAKIQQFNKVTVDQKSEILVSQGSTGAYVCAAKTLFMPGDEVILFEPFYGYHKSILELLGIKVVTPEVTSSNQAIDISALQNCITQKTRGIVICTPNNPAGKVFSKEELIAIGEFANQHDLFIFADEIYEYITYPGYEHISIASLNNYWQRTVTISGFSKTYNVTGWRLGYAYAPAEIINKMALVHDLLYICPPTPLQHAMISALAIEQKFYADMREEFLKKRDYMVNALRDIGFVLQEPQGAYYLMVDFSKFGYADDAIAAQSLLEHARVATVPGRAFYQNPVHGKHLLRICYALDENKLYSAIDNLYGYLKTT